MAAMATAEGRRAACESTVRDARLRAAVDRMHAAQLAALALPAAPEAPGAPAAAGTEVAARVAGVEEALEAAGTEVAPRAAGTEVAPRAAGTEVAPRAAAAGCAAAGREAFAAERQLLAQVAEMGSLLVRLGLLAQADVAAVEIRRRLVALAVACGNTLAELVTLAFEVAGAGAEADGTGEPAGASEDGAQSATGRR